MYILLRVRPPHAATYSIYKEGKKEQGQNSVSARPIYLDLYAFFALGYLLVHADVTNESREKEADKKRDWLELV